MDRGREGRPQNNVWSSSTWVLVYSVSSLISWCIYYYNDVTSVNIIIIIESNIVQMIIPIKTDNDNKRYISRLSVNTMSVCDLMVSCQSVELSSVLGLIMASRKYQVSTPARISRARPVTTIKHKERSVSRFSTTSCQPVCLTILNVKYLEKMKCQVFAVFPLQF